MKPTKDKQCCGAFGEYSSAAEIVKRGVLQSQRHTCRYYVSITEVLQTQRSGCSAIACQVFYNTIRPHCPKLETVHETRATPIFTNSALGGESL